MPAIEILEAKQFSLVNRGEYSQWDKKSKNRMIIYYNFVYLKTTRINGNIFLSKFGEIFSMLTSKIETL